MTDAERFEMVMLHDMRVKTVPLTSSKCHIMLNRLDETLGRAMQWLLQRGRKFDGGITEVDVTKAHYVMNGHNLTADVFWPHDMKVLSIEVRSYTHLGEGVTTVFTVDG